GGHPPVVGLLGPGSIAARATGLVEFLDRPIADQAAGQLECGRVADPGAVDRAELSEVLPDGDEADAVATAGCDPGGKILGGCDVAGLVEQGQAGAGESSAVSVGPVIGGPHRCGEEHGEHGPEPGLIVFGSDDVDRVGPGEPAFEVDVAATGGIGDGGVGVAEEDVLDGGVDGAA